MNRLALGVLVIGLALAACTPNLSPAAGQNAQATTIAQAGTSAAETVASLPTLTMPPATDTATMPPATQTSTSTPPASATSTVAAATTVTGTLSSPTSTVTGTISSPTNTATATSTLNTSGTPATVTPTDDMVPRFYGTQPPMIQYGRVRLINQAKAQVYVSFQCTTPDGYYVIVEYPVSGTITVSVPTGRCDYVAWVGGREFVGKIGLGRFEELTMTFKKQSIIIK